MTEVWCGGSGTGGIGSWRRAKGTGCRLHRENETAMNVSYPYVLWTMLSLENIYNAYLEIIPKQLTIGHLTNHDTFNVKHKTFQPTKDVRLNTFQPTKDIRLKTFQPTLDVRLKTFQPTLDVRFRTFRLTLDVRSKTSQLMHRVRLRSFQPMAQNLSTYA
ncbi:hypothetical protein M0804_009550 [Polistes exclamans]|nr:hypothetical protein M0804_009550 [Polistes exclamans]